MNLDGKEWAFISEGSLREGYDVDHRELGPIIMEGLKLRVLALNESISIIFGVEGTFF